MITYFSGGSVVNNPLAISGDAVLIPRSGRFPGEGNGNSFSGKNTPVFLPEKSHRQRSLVGYHPQGCKESDVTEPLSM